MSKAENQQNQRDIDLISRGLGIVRFLDSSGPTQHTWQKNGVLFLKKSDPKTLQRMNMVRINDKKDLSEWVMGKGILAGIGLRAYVDEAMTADESTRAELVAALPTAVSKIQEDLQSQVGNLDISQFTVKKEVMKIITQLDSSLQTGLLILNPKKIGDAKPEMKSSSSPDASNVYAKQFRDLIFYKHFVDSQAMPEDIDEFGQAVLRWLAEDWKKNVGEASSPNKDVQLLIDCSFYAYLKISFEGRQLFRNRPLQAHLPLFYPLFKRSLAESLTVRKKISELIDVRGKELARDASVYLKNARTHLQKATEEVEGFLAVLPKTIKEAEKYYSEFRLSLPERLSPAVKKQEKQRAKRKKGDSYLSRANWSLVIMTSVALAVLVSANWADITRRIHFWVGATVGSDIGVISSKLEDDRWTGVVDLVRWDRLSNKEKLELGLYFLQEMEKHRLSEMTLVTPTATVLANTIHRDNDVIWRVEGVGVFQRKKTNEINSYMPK